MGAWWSSPCPAFLKQALLFTALVMMGMTTHHSMLKRRWGPVPVSACASLNNNSKEPWYQFKVMHSRSAETPRTTLLLCLNSWYYIQLLHMYANDVLYTKHPIWHFNLYLGFQNFKKVSKNTKQWVSYDIFKHDYHCSSCPPLHSLISALPSSSHTHTIQHTLTHSYSCTHTVLTYK